MRDGIKLFTSIYIPKDTTLRYPIMLNRTPYYPIDWVNRNAMIGYWIAGDYQGKGIMTRACTALISYAFETLRLHRIDIRCATGNAKSCAIPRRLGFSYEGILREAKWLYDHFVDLNVYSMLDREWRERQRSYLTPSY